MATGHVWELRYTDLRRNSNKFYRLYKVNAGEQEFYLVYNWGRWGTRGQFMVDRFHGEGALLSAMHEKMDQKEDKGYTQIRNEALPVVPHDILGVIEDKMNTTIAADPAAPAPDVFDQFTADIDQLVREITSASTLTPTAMALHQRLQEQVGTLQARLAIAQGQLEMTNDFIRTKVGA